MKDYKGFTLIELVITVVIVGILSAIAVTSYANYTKRAKMTEAEVIIGSVTRAEKAYYIETGSYLELNKTSYSEVLDVDIRANKYYRAFYVFTPGIDLNADFTVVVLSEDDVVKDLVVVMHAYTVGESVYVVENLTDGTSKVAAKIRGEASGIGDGEENGGESGTTDGEDVADGNDDDNYDGDCDDDDEYYDGEDGDDDGCGGHHHGHYDHHDHGNHYGNGGTDNNDNDNGGQNGDNNGNHD